MNAQPAHEAVDRIFERYTQPGSAGCAVAVMKSGKTIYQQGYGLANLELESPVLPSTVFNIGSMAKQFTAFAIALLEAESRLSYDDDVRKHLPELHDFGHTITIRHLLHHTSGLRGSFPELLALAEWRDADVTTTDDVYRLLKAQRALNYRPGDEFLYVNSNYVLLALICQALSGQTLAEFSRERIFEPLGMAHTLINDDLTKLIPGRALGYYDDGQGNWFNAPLNDSVVGPTNVYSTVDDLLKWDANLTTGEVGGKAVIERMHQRGRLNDGTEVDYAFGLMLGPAHQHRGHAVVQHGGGQGGYGSWMVRFPEQQLTVAVLFNHFLWEMQHYAFQVADAFLEGDGEDGAGPEQEAASERGQAAIHLGEKQLKPKVGVYYNASRAAIREIACTDGRLQFQGQNLVPLQEHLFAFEVDPNARVRFTSAEDGSVTGMATISSLGEYEYERVATASPAPEVLQQYAGRYYSPELDLFWTIEAGDSHLTARRRKYVDSKLTPIFAHAFRDDWSPIMGYPATYLVVFDLDERGAVTGLRVSGTRVRNLRFVKQSAVE